MMIKSMARKSVSFGQLLDYFSTPEEAGPALLHNLQSRQDDSAAIRAEFNTNAHLLPPRKNGNALYHEILSFGAGDGAALTPAILEDLTRRYLDLRAPYSLGYAKAHFDTDCPHVHLLISANNVGSHQRLRLPKQRFRELQRELERYQKERYPFLSASLAQERQPRRGVQETRSEQERRRRGDRTPSRKETVRELITGEMAVARSGPDFYRRLLSQGLRLYRRGMAIGVEDLEDCRRYRLKTLGLAESFDRSMTAWRRLPEQLREIPSPSRSRPEPQRSRDRQRDR
jgi:hypothetical protein